MTTRMLLMLLALLSTAGAQAAIYKWVDEQGVTQYTARPPKSGDYKRLKGGEPRTIAPAAQAEPAPAQPDAASAADAERATHCATARRNQELLEGDDPLTLQGADGTPQVVAPERRAELLHQAEKDIAYFCED